MGLIAVVLLAALNTAEPCNTDETLNMLTAWQNACPASLSINGGKPMSRFIAEYEPQTVAELQAILADLPGEMPVSDALGELLNIRVYEDDDSNRTLEFQ